MDGKDRAMLVHPEDLSGVPLQSLLRLDAKYI